MSTSSILDVRSVKNRGFYNRPVQRKKERKEGRKEVLTTKQASKEDSDIASPHDGWCMVGWDAFMNRRAVVERRGRQS